MKRVSLSRGVLLFPTLCTTASMFCSFFSIVRSINGDYVVAAWAILVASFFDLIDGRIARMTKSQSEFGKEYDSLVDLASFGMAPAILVYTWSLSQFRSIGWFLSFVFFASVALRLARYNVLSDSAEKRFFSGLPCPPAACVLSSFVLFCEGTGGLGLPRDVTALVLVPCLAVLMVSRIRYRSFKEYDVKRQNSFYVLIGATLFIGVIALKPEVVLFSGFMIYSLWGPLVSLASSPDKRRIFKGRAQKSAVPQKLSVIEMIQKKEETR